MYPGMESGGALGAGQKLELRFQSPLKTGCGSGSVDEIVRGWGAARERERLLGKSST